MATRQSLPDRSDVVIIGGGVMGTSVAYSLTEESDYQVTLIEKDNLASGSTGDSSAVIRYNYGDKEVYTRLSKWSHDFYRNFEQLTGNPLAYNECERVRFGVEGTEEGEFVQSGYEVMTSLNVPCRRYTQDELSDRFPMFQDVDRFDFAVSDTAAAYADGTDAANGFAKAARRGGAKILTGVEALDFGVESGEITSVKTSEGMILSERVVVAAGPWTPKLGDKLDIHIPIMPTREEVVILDPPQEFATDHLDKLPIARFFGKHMYIRPDFGGGVLMATHPYPDEPSDPDAYSDQPSQETIINFIDTLEEEIPGLVDSDITGRYCGLYSTTPDHDYIIDQVGPEGCYFVCGFSGHGFKHAPAIGKMVHDLIIKGESKLVDLDYFSYNRFEHSSEGRGQPVDPL